MENKKKEKMFQKNENKIWSSNISLQKYFLEGKWINEKNTTNVMNPEESRLLKIWKTVN